MDAGTFFKRVASVMKENPPAQHDTPALEGPKKLLVLILSPSLFGWLIPGAELSEAGQALGRLAGIVLLAFGVACRPAPAAANQATSAVRALLIYNLLATIYLFYLGSAANW